MIGLVLREHRAAQAALGAHRGRRAARRRDDRRHLRPDGPDPQRRSASIQKPTNERRGRGGRAEGGVHAASSARPAAARRESLIDARHRRPGRRARSQGELWAAGALVIDGKLQKSTRRRRHDHRDRLPEPFNAGPNVARPAARALRARWRCYATARREAAPRARRPVGIATRTACAGHASSASFDLGDAPSAAAPTSSRPGCATSRRWFDREGEVTTHQRRRRRPGVRPRSSPTRIARPCPARPRGAHRRGRRPTRTPTRSTTRSAASSRPRCSPSPARRCWSARSSSSTPSRSPSPAHARVRAAAHARRDAPPGARRRRARGARARPHRLGRSASASGCCSPRRSARCSTRSAWASRAAGWCSRRGRSWSRSRVGVGVTLVAALAPALRATRVSRRSRRCSASDAGRAGGAGAGRRHRRGHRRPGRRRHARAPGLFARRPGDQPAVASMGAGVVLLFIGVALERALRSSARSPARSAGRSSACSPSPASSRARTRCATRAAPRPPPRR